MFSRAYFRDNYCRGVKKRRRDPAVEQASSAPSLKLLPTDSTDSETNSIGLPSLPLSSSLISTPMSSLDSIIFMESCVESSATFSSSSEECEERMTEDSERISETKELNFKNYQEVQVEKIFQGGQGTVYSFFSERFPSYDNVCVKVFSPAMEQACNNEIEVYQLLGKHANIVKFIQLCWSETSPGFMMEYMSNGSLTRYLNKPDVVTTDRILIWLHQLSTALQFLKNYGIVHRDIKPCNILLSAAFDTIKLADFGHSHILGKPMKNRPGTLSYSPPECIFGQTYSYPCDVYSFAMTIWSIVHGRHPFTDDYGNTVRVPFKWKSTLRDEIEKTCSDLRMLFSSQPTEDEMLFFREYLKMGSRFDDDSYRPVLRNYRMMEPAVYQGLKNLMQECWKTNPDERSPIEDIVELTLSLKTANQRAKQKLAIEGPVQTLKICTERPWSIPSSNFCEASTSFSSSIPREIYNSSRKKERQEYYEFLEKTGNHVPRSEFQFQLPIKSGSYGYVYRATYKGAKFAVKCFDTKKGEAKLIHIRELVYLQRLHHPNLIELHHVITAYRQGKTTYVGFAMDFHHYDLYDYVIEKKNSKTEIPRHQKYTWILQIISVVAYVHRQGLIIRDIKPANLLLTKQLGIKLIDFGSIKKWDELMTLSNVVTLKFGAPEAHIEREHEFASYSEKVDVYSVGVLIYFIFTERVPYDGLKLDSTNYAEHVRKRPLQMTGEEDDNVKELFYSCTKYDPQQRPTMDTVLEIAEEHFSKKGV